MSILIDRPTATIGITVATSSTSSPAHEGQARHDPIATKQLDQGSGLHLRPADSMIGLAGSSGFSTPVPGAPAFSQERRQTESSRGQGDLDYDDMAEADNPTEDSLGAYLRDIGSIPLLTASEEVMLARTLEQGNRAAERLAGSLDEEERLAAERDVALGEEARRKLIESNLRLVVSIARRYSERGLPLSDLIEEGNLGLIRAVEKFDFRKGFRFSTYATWWIRQSVSRGLVNQARPVRLPVHVSELVGQLWKVFQGLSHELGREPTAAEMGEQLGLSAERVRAVLSAAQQPVSLSQPVSGGDEASVEDIIQDTSAACPEEHVSQRMLREEVCRALHDLDERERRVISLRYGLGDGVCRTLDEVGRLLGLTRERIRQIEKHAIEQLRRAPGAESLRECLG